MANHHCVRGEVRIPRRLNLHDSFQITWHRTSERSVKFKIAGLERNPPKTGGYFAATPHRQQGRLESF